MKKNLFSIIVIVLGTISVHAQEVTIPDANFLAALVAKGVDLNKDGKIQLAEAASVTDLDIYRKGITDLTGIEAFTSLSNLNCGANQLTTLNFNSNELLDTLYCQANLLTSLDVSKNVRLRLLYCNTNQLVTLDLSQNKVLANLSSHYNSLISLDVSYCAEIIIVDCYVNKLQTLKLSDSKKLKNVACFDNLLTSLDLSQNSSLALLTCDKNQLTYLNLGKNDSLQYVTCYKNNLKQLDVSNNNGIININCSYNPSLKEICINEQQISLTPSWGKDSTAIWNSNCGMVTNLETGMSEVKAPHLIKTINLLGQDVADSEGQPGIYIYLYDDGSKRKVGRR